MIFQFPGDLRAIVVRLVDDESNNHFITVHDDMTRLLVDFSHPLFQPFERGVYHTVDSDLDGFVKRKGISLADFERFHTALDFYFDVFHVVYEISCLFLFSYRDS